MTTDDSETFSDSDGDVLRTNKFFRQMGIRVECGTECTPDHMFAATIDRTNLDPGCPGSDKCQSGIFDRSFDGPDIQTHFDLGNDTLLRLSDPVQTKTGIATAPSSVTSPCGLLWTIRANRIAPCAKKFPTCAKKISSNPGLEFRVPALKRAGMMRRLATFYVVFSAGHAEGTQNSMLDPKFRATLFLVDLVSQNQISSQEQGPQQFGDSLSAAKGALFFRKQPFNQPTHQGKVICFRKRGGPAFNQPTNQTKSRSTSI